jgi:hypothetical protein
VDVVALDSSRAFAAGMLLVLLGMDPKQRVPTSLPLTREAEDETTAAVRVRTPLLLIARALLLLWQHLDQ